MVEYRCECCNYVTNKKSNFDSHNVSKKHLEKVNGSDDKSVTSEKSIKMETIYPQETNVSNDSYLILKIRELENALKLKDLEIKMKDEQIELLKCTIQTLSQPNKHVAEENVVLTPTAEENIVLAPIAVEKQEPSSSPPTLFRQKLASRPAKKITENIAMNIEEINNKTAKSSNEPKYINIEEFFEIYIRSREQTKYTYKYTNQSNNEYVKFIALKPLYYKKEYSDFNIMKAVLELIYEAMEILFEKNETFYICNDVNRRKFTIKTKGNFINSRDNKEEVHKTILSLFKKTYGFLFDAYTKFNTYFSKRITYLSCDEEKDISMWQEKKQYEGIEPTDHQKEKIAKYKTNRKVQREFENATGVNYRIFLDDANWSSKLALKFYNYFTDEKFDAGFSHLRTIMATKKFNEKLDEEISKEEKTKKDDEKDDDKEDPPYVSDSE
jgi:hypothetical protein